MAGNSAGFPDRFRIRTFEQGPAARHLLGGGLRSFCYPITNRTNGAGGMRMVRSKRNPGRDGPGTKREPRQFADGNAAPDTITEDGSSDLFDDTASPGDTDSAKSSWSPPAEFDFDGTLVDGCILESVIPLRCQMARRSSTLAGIKPKRSLSARCSPPRRRILANAIGWSHCCCVGRRMSPRLLSSGLRRFSFRGPARQSTPVGIHVCAWRYIYTT